jgi:xanthine dehydrogenase YagS FAD-binding subunit
MNSFTYSFATEVPQAVGEIVNHPTAKFIAGGTNLLDLMKENVEKPPHLVDLNGLGLTKIEETPTGGLLLGALVSNADTAYNEQVEKRYPLLAQAILSGASAQLRNMATNGGNLLQRTRCYYFYDTDTPCNKRDPGSGCPAKTGHNRIHAILGTSNDCIATHPSDMCIALAALEAVVHVSGSNGARTIPFDEFHRLPGDTPHLDNNLSPDEVVTGIELPPRGFPQHYAYLKLRDRASYAFALVSVAVGLEIENGIVTEARLALGGVAHKPWRVPEAEALLVGQEPTKELFESVAKRVLAGAQGYGENDFKLELAPRAIVRALNEAVHLNRGGAA